MNYKAFLSVIVILALAGTVLVLLQQKTDLETHVANLTQQQKDALPPAATVTTPTDLVVTDTESMYPREKLSRQSDRCDYDNCLFVGGGGLVGTTSLDAFFTSVTTKDMDGNDLVCQALYVKRGPSVLVTDPKFTKFYNEKTGILVLPYDPTSVLDLTDLEQIQQSNAEAPRSVSVFIPDSLETGSDPCYGGFKVLDVGAL